jgi:hypothetical protein
MEDSNSKRIVMIKYLTIIFLFFNLLSASAQPIDHWETIVYNNDQWRYSVGFGEPPADWMQSSFND